MSIGKIDMLRKIAIIINGTMGVGKTTVCERLASVLDRCAWLDGDWCWRINPFNVNDENRAMVQDNIRHVLANFVKNSSIDTVIFSWVIHTREILDMVTGWFDTLQCDCRCLTLTCTVEELTARIRSDMLRKTRDEDDLKQSIERLPLYDGLDTVKIDTTRKSVDEIVGDILRITR